MIYLKRSVVHLFALLLVFFPVQYNIDQVNVSVNYIFILIFILLSRGLICDIKADVKIIWIYFVLSLFFGAVALIVVDNFSTEMMARMFLSWLLVVSPYFIMLLKIDLDRAVLKKSIILIAALYSLIAIYFLFADNFLKGIFFPQMIKGSMAETMPEWPDRFTPILVLAGFILYFDEVGYDGLLRAVLIAILGMALLFTFSRAIYIGIFFVILLKILSLLIRRKIKFKPLAILLFFVGILIAIIYSSDVAGEIFSNIYNFIYESFDTFSDSVDDSKSSAGARFERVNYLSSLLLYAPFGHGGLGISSINADFGSSESQYIDYLVRFGFPGLFIMLYIHLKAYIKSRNDIFLRGFPEYIIFLTVFGIFHETIRLPYVLLTILITIVVSDSKVLADEKTSWPRKP